MTLKSAVMFQIGADIIQRRYSDEKKRRHSPKLSLLLLGWHLNDPRFVNDASSPEHEKNLSKGSQNMLVKEMF